MRILLTGARAPVALELARRFARVGHHVQVADSLAFPLAGFSRYVARRHRLPPPRHQSDLFGKALRDIVGRERIDLVIPTCEEVLWLAYQGCPGLFAPSSAQLVELHNKWTFHQKALKLGLSSPESYRIESVEAALERLEQPGPWVMKPVFSRFGTQTRLRPRRALVAGLDIRPERPWIVQKLAQGPLLCSYSVVRQGCLRAHVTYDPVLKLGEGAGVIFRSVDNPLVESWVTHFVRELNLSGQLAFDFIHTDQGVTALECNPRATSGAHLFASDSRLVEAFVGDSNQLYRCEEGRCAMLEGAAVWASPRACLATRARPVIWDRHDLRPCLGQLLSLGEMLVRAWRSGHSLLEATTSDIEWDRP